MTLIRYFCKYSQKLNSKLIFLCFCVQNIAATQNINEKYGKDSLSFDDGTVIGYAFEIKGI